MKKGSNTIKKASTKELLALAQPHAKAAELTAKAADQKAQVAKAAYKAARKVYKHAKKSAKKAAKLAKRAQEKVLALKEAAQRTRKKVAPKPAVAPQLRPAKALPLKKKVTPQTPNSVSATAQPDAAAAAVLSPPLNPALTQLPTNPAPEQPQAKPTKAASQ